jgi:hypothetical protein
MATPFSIPLGTGAAYSGQADAHIFELASPDNPVPTHHIRTTQDWGVRVRWEVEGAFVPFLVDEFHVYAFIESIGPGQELAPGPVVVGTMSSPLLPGNKRVYETSVNIPKGTINPGVYKMAVMVQLCDDAPPATPYPVVAAIELPLVTVFKPA